MTNRNPDESYCLFGVEVIQKRLQAFTKEIEGVRRAEDIEYIHRMRVATRRLRAAFTLFDQCFPGKRFGEWVKQIRRITRSLGAARDTDVQMEYVSGILESLEAPEAYAGVKRLMLRLKQRRERLQADVLGALERLERSGVIRDIESTVMQRIVHARLNDIRPQSPQIYAHAYDVSMLRLEEMLAYEIYISQPECVSELHEMRIAAKRLRYTLEIFEPLYNGEMKRYITAVKDVQEYLGDIHDADVWISWLPEFREEEKQRTLEYHGTIGPFGRLLAGIDYLEKERQAFRKKCYKDFLEYWKQLQEEGLWADLRRTLLKYTKESPPVLTTEELELAIEPVPGEKHPAAAQSGA